MKTSLQQPSASPSTTMLLVLALTIGFFEQPQSRHEIEYRFKAVYLFNFLQFIEWPSSAFESEQSPIILAVLGKDPFGNVLDETIHSEKIGARPIIVRRFRSVEDLSECHALFISPMEKETLQAVFRRLGESSVLTVSDIDGFTEFGGGISFYMEKNKIRFEINTETTKRVGLKVSSKLLRLARVVGPS